MGRHNRIPNEIAILLFSVALFFDTLEIILDFLLVGLVLNPFIGVMKIATLNLILIVRAGRIFSKPTRITNFGLAYFLAFLGIPLVDLINLALLIHSVRKEDRELARAEAEQMRQQDALEKEHMQRAVVAEMASHEEQNVV